VSDLRAKLLAAGDRETVELGGIGTVEVRSCRVAESLEYARRLTEAAGLRDGEVETPAAAHAAMQAQGYLISVTVRDPDTGDLLFDPSAAEEVAQSMGADHFRILSQAGMRVCGFGQADQPSKNGSRASGESSTASPVTSIAPLRSSEDDSLPLSTVSG
jgi:hypothetical protein